MTDIIIDNEFKALIPALQADEYERLEQSILSEGCRDALVVWQGTNILVDGHNRYEICTKHGIAYNVVERAFNSRVDVAEWMLTNQLARRNLTDATRAKMVIKFKAILEDEAKERMLSGIKQDPVENFPQGTIGKTRDKLGKLAGMSGKKFSQAEKVINDAPALIKKQWEEENLSTHRAYELTRALEDVPESYIERVSELCGDDYEKVRILTRLKRSSMRGETNGTFDEIMRKDEFHHYLKDKKLVKFSTASIDEINKALQSISDYHRMLAMEQKKADGEAKRIEEAKQIEKPNYYVHGNCLDVLPTLAPKSVRLLLTDPPYGTNYQSNRRTASAQADKIASDDNLKSATQLLSDMLATINYAMHDDCRILIFTSQVNYPAFRNVVEQSGYKVGRILTWVKENHTSGDLTDFAPQTEWIINAWRGNHDIAPRISEVLQYKRENHTSHPTEKPIQLLRELIRVCTVSGELVVDPFAGTGATVHAALRLNRKVLGIELSESWYNEGLLSLQDEIK